MAQLAAVCRERSVTSALDNTWGAGLAFKASTWARASGRVSGSGADIVVRGAASTQRRRRTC